MKKVLVVAISLVCACMSYAQEYEYPGLKQVQKGNYEAVQKDIDKHLQKSPDDVAYLYAAAQVYSLPEFSGRDIPKAYQYICKTKEKFQRLDPAEQDKLIKKGLTKDLINTSIMEVCTQALELAKQENTEDAYNTFLRTYTRAVPSLQRQAKERLSHLAFEQAAERNTVGAYEFYMQQHPDGGDVKEAIVRRNALAYEQAKTANTLMAYKSFMENYPDADQVAEAQEQIYLLSLRDAERIGTDEAMDAYIQSFPESPFGRQKLAEQGAERYAEYIRDSNWQDLKDLAVKKKDKLEQRRMYYALLRIAQKRKSLPAAQFIYQNAPNEDVQDSAWIVMHDVYCSTGVLADISKFHDQFHNPRFADLEAHDRKIVEQYEITQTTDRGWFALIKLAAPYRVAYNWLLENRIDKHVERGDLDMALQGAKHVEDAFGNDPSYLELVAALEKGQQETITPEILSDSINTEAQEYSPVMTADGHTVYFVRVVWDKTYGNSEDIYYSTLLPDGKWMGAKPVTELSVSGSNEAMQSVSADGTKLIFFRNGLLYTTSKSTDGWTLPKPLPSTINIASWQSDAMITSDGRALLFSAQKQVENEVSSSVNIFVSLLDENGNWTEPIDLGPTINTPGMERKPFLHPDMRTLYFSSNGHGTLGDLDVFKSVRLRDDSWTEWSAPINLGAQVNSPRQEWGYKISTDGQRAYYSNGQDLFTMALPEEMRPNAVATISGKVSDETDAAVGVTIRWEDLNTHEKIGQSQTDPNNGSFYLVLPLGKNYGYYIDDERYFPLSNNIDLSDETENVNIEKNIRLTSYKQMIEEGLAVQVNNLFFPVNEYELLPQSENELIRIAAIIKERKLKVEISGHTDSSGDAKKNMTLSKQRADAVRSFLITQGCNASLLISKGYGSSRPIADNETDEGKQQNRRVELQFVK